MPTAPATGAATPGAAGQISPGALKQIAALEQEKARRTPAQQKIDSQLLYADKMQRNLPVADGVPTQRVDLDQDGQGRVLVDITAEVTGGLLRQIEALGGMVINSFPQYHAIRAAVPLAGIERLASETGVKFVGPAVRALHNNVDSQGDFTHQANTARTTFGVNGSGVKVGVLSDSEDYLASSQIAGLVTVLPGQSGEPGTGEGTAMLEIVNDLVPGAQLFFATAYSSPANFANNILQLRAAGCDIIVDDVGYFNESPFQDAVIAQAVNSVTASGALYFSSAGNSGNQDDSTAGTWEGDFSDSGQTALYGRGGKIHSFGGGTNYDTVLPGGSDLRVDLFWADPLGASTNDYDVYVLDSNSNLVASSTTSQTGTQDPYEQIGSLAAGERIVIVQYSGAGRFLHLETGRAYLTLSTPGNTKGHACATNAFCVAAVDAADAYPGAFLGGVQDPVETFSSDGPRQVFFQADGTPVTPGNFSSSGGVVRPKPDIAAADGVTTDVPGFAPFYGTSAAAPHAAAIAALLKSYNPALSPAQMRTVLTNTALDIMAPGYDRDSGSGIVMALAALLSTSPDGLRIAPSSTFSASGPVGGPFNPTSQVYSLTNVGGTSLSWSLINTSLWLTASGGGGTLTPGGAAASVTVSLNSTANNLLAGVYTANIFFTNLTSQLTQSRQILLRVGQPLVQNGGFETGDFSFWTLVSDQFSFVDNGSITGILPHSGSYFAALGQSGSVGYLSQTLSTVANQAYLLSAWFNSPTYSGGNTPNEFSVSWNGSTLFDQVNIGPIGWTNLQFIVTATSTNTVLQFGERVDPWYLGLDDVTVVPIPNPSFRSVINPGGNAIVFSWNSLASIAYQVQYTTNLASPNWIVLSTNTATGPVLTLTNAFGTDPRRFYRIRRLP
ncbi:MAG: S8 family serine peptidase [Verrucomicrobiia bacterium]